MDEGILRGERAVRSWYRRRFMPGFPSEFSSMREMPLSVYQAWEQLDLSYHSTGREE